VNVKIVNYIQRSYKISLKESREKILYNRIPIYIKDQLPKNIDLDYILDFLESSIPHHLVSEVETIYIAHIEDFDRRDINAMYKDGAIYITNKQDDMEDMLDDIVHEIAHSVEILHPAEIYADGELENEFISKRLNLYYLLKSHGYNINMIDFVNSEYSKDLDNFFYKEVEYSRLQNYIIGLFNTPYAVTSLREYFANGFEEFYLGDKKMLKDISPFLYNKILFLHEGEFEYEMETKY